MRLVRVKVIQTIKTILVKEECLLRCACPVFIEVPVTRGRAKSKRRQPKSCVSSVDTNQAFCQSLPELAVVSWNVPRLKVGRRSR